MMQPNLLGRWNSLGFEISDMAGDKLRLSLRTTDGTEIVSLEMNSTAARDMADGLHAAAGRAKRRADDAPGVQGPYR